MVHPYIAALRKAPFNYVIEQPDEDDEEQYTYSCADGVVLQIHVMKPSMFWMGYDVNKEMEVKKEAFSATARNAANSFSRDFNEVKMEIGIPKPGGAVEPEASKKTVEVSKAPSKPSTKQTQLAIPDKAVAVSEPKKTNGFFFTERQIEAMKHTVAKGASQAEFEMFIYLATKYKLDPFLKEIFYIPGNMKTILTSRDGYLKVAQNHKDFEGIRSMAVRANDDFELDLEKDTVIHKFGKVERGPIIGAWAIVYRKHRRPVIAYADLSEYQGQTQPWKKYTSAMICKCAEAFALKRQFAISGLVTMEEMDVDPIEIVDPELIVKDFGFDDVQDADFEEME